ncbi:MAG: GntR family transcriptional regulator [Clostridia bacterium]|nr:GntR family transcriptional regulator [Clostridia bacterium]
MDHQMLSLADQVFDVIERDILNGTYERGETLTELSLSEQLGVSRTPVREAIRRLVQEHLLEMTNHGVQVVGVSPSDIQDIYEIRYRLESLAARRVAEHATPEQLAQMKEDLDLQAFYTERNDSENIKEMDSRFHLAIYRACGSAPIQHTLEPLLMRIVKYRKASLAAPDRAVKSLEEHRAIYRAISEHNGDEAERLVKEHIRAASTSILFQGGAASQEKTDPSA